MIEITQVWAMSDEAHVGRITAEKPIEEEVIVCPELCFGGILVERTAMRNCECLLRLRMAVDPCNRCGAVNHLRAKLGWEPVPEEQYLEYVRKKKERAEREKHFLAASKAAAKNKAG